MSTTRPSRAGWARLALALSLLPLLALTGCAAVMANLVKATATEQRSFTTSAQPSVIVEIYNGPITVKVSSGRCAWRDSIYATTGGITAR